MGLDERLENVAVIGAAGKMGSGIATLLALEMARLRNVYPDRRELFQLHLIDSRREALDALRAYIESQARKAASKRPEDLRTLYTDGPHDDAALAERFVRDVLEVIELGTGFDRAQGAHLVFEAIVENEDVKIDVFSQLKAICSDETFFLSNTSSIPISVIDQGAGLEGRILGFHFYNPPVVQKLVELIIGSTTRSELAGVSRELGLRLGKRLVTSADIAGFIGNGHFIREGLYALETAAGLQPSFMHVDAVYAVNRVSQDWLLRPMGIFQLIDYVGLDVFSSITEVMERHLSERFHHDLLASMLRRGALGGQNPDGSQKDGFFTYRERRPVGVFSLEEERYFAFEEGELAARVDERLGPLPAGDASWKGLVGDPDRGQKLADYFQKMAQIDALGATLARAYLRRSRAIGERLVSDGVAGSREDVNAVLQEGFFHLYGPINNYMR